MIPTPDVDKPLQTIAHAVAEHPEASDRLFIVLVSNVHVISRGLIQNPIHSATEALREALRVAQEACTCDR